jgi:hypothetical protein
MARSNVTADWEEDALDEKRTPEQREALERLLKLAEEQGVKPLTLEDLDAMGQVWPEDESVDEFLEARERWRKESRHRELP